MSRNAKIIICNVVILLICVAAIVTLSVGSFFKADLNITVKGSDFAKSEGSGSGEGEGEGDDFYKAMEGVELKLPLSLDIKASDIMTSLTKKGGEGTKLIIDRTLAGTIDSLLASVDDIMVQMSDMVIDVAFDALKDELASDLGDGATEAEINAELQEKYGISNDDIETLQTEVSDSLKAMINGEEGDVVAVVRDSETLNNICLAMVKEQAGKEGKEMTEEEIQQKASEMHDSFVDSYEEMVGEMEVDGKISSENMLTSVMNTAGVKNEDGTEKKFESVDDVKAYLSEKVYGMVGEKEEVITKVLQGLGIFIIFVIACWAYVILKLIIKLFMKNKTVRVGLPQAFGWMPHVFFVGLPMTFIKVAPLLIQKLPEQAGEQVKEILDQITSMVSVTVSSLTWVSALCTVFLLIVTIPYYRYRRQIKKEKKSGTGTYGEMDFTE